MRGAGGAFDNFVLGGAGARAWLRRVMPHVALAAALVVLAWVVVKRTGWDRVGAVALFFDVAFIAVYLAAVYYGARALRWLKNKLLWRVRRRLVITYLFVGLTPVVLLAALAALTGLVGLNQIVSRVVKINLAAREGQALQGARTLARGFAQQPANADAKTVQAWLDDRVSLLRSSLPGARVAVWRGESGARGATAGARRRDGAGAEAGNSFDADVSRPAQFASEPGEAVERVAGDLAPTSEPLPAWLRDRDEWHGMAFAPPSAADVSGFASPSLRALVRERTPDGRGVALLLVVPVSRELVRQLRENTGLAVHPFFLGAEGTEVTIVRETFGAGKVSIGDQRAVRRDPDNPNSGFFVVTPERSYRIDFRRDQFGEPTNTSSLVFLRASSWADGHESLRLAFLCEFSALAVARQLFGEEGVGRISQSAIAFGAACFLLLELLALLSAAWMTRAVTGTVHRLYRATEFIKRGDFSHRVSVRSHDQLGELAEAFNEMSADIETLLEERVEREKLEREIEIAAEVQAQLFPREVPQLAGAEIAGECRAARGVAGDYYDYIELQPGLVAFTLADVSGKGISAALVMSNLQASLRAQTTILAERLKLSTRVTVKGAAAGDDQDFEMPCGVAGLDTDCAVENMAASINDQLCRSTDSNRFATVFLALYDERTRALRYTNAGHNAPLLVRAGGAIERLDVGGTVLGAFDWARYEEAATTFEPGDLLLIFSDGISESQNEAGEEYGDERIARFTAANRDSTAEELVRAMFLEIGMWSGGREREDDQTVVVLKARG
ncbi:MAG TPA: SpoIIE family protein phosphatase [Pyrinomonadaceae bacterium]|jgi:sigma-B regulation protein RsbU (phosphoserine phosphatase)|nr:SpoIIE family protein phosphatase [Pyrinomonadaceae bacterium]